MTDISNCDDIINPDDVRERIEELETERSELESAIEEAQEERSEYPIDPADKEEDDAKLIVLDEAINEARFNLTAWNTDNGPELKSLTDFADEFGDADGLLIRESYFEDHARDLAEDLHGRVVRDVQWPFSCIDWEQAASELQHDYGGADFDGVTYYFHG